MNLKNWIPLIVALGLGGIAAKIAHDVSARKAAPAASKGIQVVVAKGPIAPGSELTSEEIGLAPIAGDNVPAKSFATPSDVVGRVVTTPLVDGQPILMDFLAPKGTAAGLESLIPPGMRAMTVDVSETSGVAGMLAPGCHVDVVCTLNGADGKQTITRSIVQNVLITAVGQRLSPTRGEGDKDTGSYKTVTFIISGHDAQLIELATSTARTRLVLRPHGDDKPTERDGVTLAELRGRHQEMADATPVSGDRKVIRSMTIIRGGTPTQMEFEMTSSIADQTMTDTDQQTPAIQD